MPDLLDAALSSSASSERELVIEQTDPTPESAQPLAAALSSTTDASFRPEVIDSAALTDSTFARAVDEFTSAGPAPIVEASSTASSPGTEVPAEATVSGTSDEKFDELEMELSDADVSDAATEQPLSEAEADEILSHSDAGSPPKHDIPKNDNGAPITDAPHAPGSAPPQGNGALPPAGVGAASVVVPTVVTSSANADVFVKSTRPARTGSRFSFWPFGRKRSTSAGSGVPPILSSSSHESEAVIDVTESDPSISITSSSTFDLALAPDSTRTTASPGPASFQASDARDEIAAADLRDSSLTLIEPDTGESDNLEPINIELSDAGSWESPDGIEGLELEPHAGSAAVAALPGPSRGGIDLDDLAEQELAVDELICDYPANAPELELPTDAPLPATDEAVLHVAAPTLEFPPQPTYASPSVEEAAIDVGGALGTHLAAAPIEELAVIEPAPVVVEPSASEFHSAEEIALPVSGAAPIVIETAASAFHPTEEIPLSPPQVAVAAEVDPLLESRLSEAAADNPLSEGVPAVIEPAASAFHPHEEIPLSVPPVTAAPEAFVLTEQISLGVSLSEGLISTTPVGLSIEFASEAETSAGIVDEQAVDEPFFLNEDAANPESSSVPDQLPVVAEGLADGLPFFDIDSSDAPALAVNEAELASVAEATREILADATPLPPPRPAKRVAPPKQPAIPEDFELPPPLEEQVHQVGRRRGRSRGSAVGDSGRRTGFV